MIMVNESYFSSSLPHFISPRASLGGGLAIITGAQTDAYAVAISGPGATLSRMTYDPPVELDKLNTQVR